MKYFGTDGIRGVAGIELDEDIAFRCGYALSALKKSAPVVLARDTRESGCWLAEAFASGINAAGGTVIFGGVLPTPAVASAVKGLGAAAGAVISASHNPSHYNGIKLFDASGYKLDRYAEEHLETVMDGVYFYKTPTPITEDKNVIECYLTAVNPASYDLSGLRIVLDTANGAACGIAPLIFESAGATVIAINDNKDGSLINFHSGALHPEELQKAVVCNNADLGFAFDGDADRVIAVDDNGRLVDGDGILYVLAKSLLNQNALSKNTVVATVMTNSGIEAAFRAAKINLIRVSVGDHNVAAELLKKGYSLGGEQSGHIIFAETGTGDGILAALKIAEIVKKYGNLSELFNIRLYPQKLRNVTVSEKSIPFIALENAESWRRFLNGAGRVLLRLSGTEPVIRIMAECESASLASLIVKDIEHSLKKEFSNETLSGIEGIKTRY